MSWVIEVFSYWFLCLVIPDFKNRLEREVAELQLITKLKTMEKPGLNKDIGFLSHYT